MNLSEQDQNEILECCYELLKDHNFNADEAKQELKQSIDKAFESGEIKDAQSVYSFYSKAIDIIDEAKIIKQQDLGLFLF